MTTTTSTTTIEWTTASTIQRASPSSSAVRSRHKVPPCSGSQLWAAPERQVGSSCRARAPGGSLDRRCEK
eukprot:2949269-Pyramimonas_sp.AAC.1